MNTHAQLLSRPPLPTFFAPVRSGLLKPKCGCSLRCEDDPSQHLAKPPKSTGESLVSSPADLRYGSLTSADLSEQFAQTYFHSNVRHDFGQVRVFNGPQKKKQEPEAKPSPKAPPTKGIARQQECSDKCGGTELGSAECQLDDQGMPTSKVVITVNDKHPCTSPCVKEHEEVHAKDQAPVCKKVSTCLSGAGKDDKKRNKCLDDFEKEFMGKTAGNTGTECKAYTAEEKCLTRRKSATECKSDQAQTHWKEHMDRLQCYKKCYCAK
jgi:hypothetical protein